MIDRVIEHKSINSLMENNIGIKIECPDELSDSDNEFDREMDGSDCDKVQRFHDINPKMFVEDKVNKFQSTQESANIYPSFASQPRFKEECAEYEWNDNGLHGYDEESNCIAVVDLRRDAVIKEEVEEDEICVQGNHERLLQNQFVRAEDVQVELHEKDDGLDLFQSTENKQNDAGVQRNGIESSCETSLEEEEVSDDVHCSEEMWTIETGGVKSSKVPHSSTSVTAGSSKPDKEGFWCRFCYQSFPYRSALIVHQRIHTGERQIICKYCNKEFSQMSSLVSHVRIHTGEKPYKCEYCDARFSHQGHLITHVRAHRGEKPFKCQECGRQFSINGALVNHMRVHTGEKPYKCKYCSKKFTLQGGLVQHLRIHTGEKPFACSHCDKKFTVKVTLVRHLRTHTGEKPFKCQHCDKQFTQISNLYAHLRKYCERDVKR